MDLVHSLTGTVPGFGVYSSHNIIEGIEDFKSIIENTFEKFLNDIQDVKNLVWEIFLHNDGFGRFSIGREPGTLINLHNHINHLIEVRSHIGP